VAPGVRKFAGALLRLGRISNLPTVWTNVLAGVALAGAALDASAVLQLCGAMSLLYVGGMYLNDACDYEFDRAERPERPLPAGTISRRTVVALSGAYLILGLALVAPVPRMFLAPSCGPVGIPPGASVGANGWRPFVSAIVLVALIVYYNLDHKKNPLSPAVMGLCRVGIYTTAGLSVVAPNPAIWWGAVLLFSHLVGLTYLAKNEVPKSAPGRPLGGFSKGPGSMSAIQLTFRSVPFSLSLLLLALPLIGLLVGRFPAGPVPVSLAPEGLAPEGFDKLTLWRSAWSWTTVLISGLLCTSNVAAVHAFLKAKAVWKGISAIPLLIANMSLLDGALLASLGLPQLGWLCVALWILTLVLGRFVPAS